MKILNKLTITDLKLNKKRTIGTLVGIILATALITVVGGMFFVMQNTIVVDTINMTGYYHIELTNVNDSDLKEIKNNKDFKDTHIVKRYGMAKFNLSADDIKNKARSLGYDIDVNIDDINFIQYYDYEFLSMDKSTYEFLKNSLVKGTYPKNNDEILVDPGFFRENECEIGDSISISIEGGTTKDYKIVGITSKYGSFVTSFDKNIKSNNIYLTLKHPSNYKKAFSKLLGVDDYKKNFDTKYDYSTNKDLLMWEVGDFSNRALEILYGVLGIVIGIILVTSVFSIRNSFAISVNEKTKTYGMLASIGATRKQIRKMVLLEGLYLGIIGIGLGIILGNGIIWLLTFILNTLAKSADLVTEGNFLYYKFSILPTIISIVVGAIMIYLSTLTSSIRASHISPIQNIKNSDNIKNPKKLRVPFYIKGIFKIGGVLSYKNLKRSKKKYRVTVISLTVSIFVFIVVSSFLQYSTKTIKDEFISLNYDISIENLYDETEVDVNKLINLAESHVAYAIIQDNESRSTYDYKLYDTSHALNHGIKLSYCDDYDTNGNCKNNVSYTKTNITIYDDASFKEYCKQAKLDYNKVKDKAIILDTVKRNRKYVRLTDYKVKDVLTFTDKYNESSVSYEIGAVSNEKPWGLEIGYDTKVEVIINQKYYKGDGKLVPNSIYYETKDAKKVEDEIYKISDDLYVNNLAEMANQMRTIIIILSIFIYGFIIVVTFIGITSVFNTINSNMDLRRREFAALKSIGMTKKEFNNMILLESVFYSLKSLTIGIILGIGGSYLVYQIFKKSVDFGFLLPIKPIIISIVFIIILVYTIMKYSVDKLDKENIIETIRKENI